MVVAEDKRLNELTGKEWLQHSFSIWRDIKKTAEEKKLKHPAMFPQQLTERIIKIFTKSNMTVLDPFMGTGSTVLSATLNNRKGIGFELSEEFFTIAQSRIEELQLSIFDEGQEFIEPLLFNKDCRLLKEHIEPNTVDLVVTSPPYWDILNMKRTSDHKDIVNYSDSDVDLGNIDDYAQFLNELKAVFEQVYDVIKPGGYCVVVVMDIRKKSTFYPFHSDLATKMQELGFKFEDIVIWDRQHEYNNMRPLGYPYKYRINKVHEYVLIFSK
ncbi:site-specific DNA-methyltransferase [Calidifontibacillus oryziterrae]|uniref:site-specific DNA-methyltransferase n=1 Tax=Calidifontibacillus oryziterrae TaxID=1191699 RepID=UPI0004764AF4|nr:site-specific DNA-methyltransferase [Calidifontibacillus oryziterrae]